jgi:preprotein translocase subunit SecE
VSTEALPTSAPRLPARVIGFLRDERAEIGKVTWPSRDEVRKATIVIVAFVITLGLLIGLMDSLLQLILVRTVARIF